MKKLSKKLGIVVVILSLICAIFGITVVILCCIGFLKMLGDVAICNILLSMIGAIAFLISIVGCTAIIQGDIKIALMYFGFMILVIIAYILVYFAVIMGISTKVLANAYMTKAMSTTHTNLINEIYHQKSCCGKHGTSFYVEKLEAIPDSCIDAVTHKLHTRGCNNVLRDELESVKTSIVAVVWVHVALEVVTVILTAVLLFEKPKKLKGRR